MLPLCHADPPPPPLTQCQPYSLALCSAGGSCADFANDNGSDEFNPVIIERYTPTKYTHAINAEFYGGQPRSVHHTRRSSASSQPDYRVRTLIF